MAMSRYGHSYNPGTLNARLKLNRGYISGNIFIWTAVNKLGITYQGKVVNTEILKKLDLMLETSSFLVLILFQDISSFWLTDTAVIIFC